jgi:hypothetical protein
MPERLDAGVGGAHVNGSLSGLEESRGCRRGCQHALAPRSIIDRGPDGSGHLDPQRFSEEALASSGLFRGRGAVSMASKATHEELLERLT